MLWSLLFESFVHHLKFASKEKCTHVITLLKCFFKSIIFSATSEFFFPSIPNTKRNRKVKWSTFVFSENKNIRSLLHPKMRPRRKQNFLGYLPLLTTFLVSQYFCPIRFASVSFRTCLSPSLTLNFLNTYSAIRKIRIILPWPQHEA